MISTPLLLALWAIGGVTAGCVAARLVGRDTNDPLLAGIAFVVAGITAPVLVPGVVAGGVFWLIGWPFVKDW